MSLLPQLLSQMFVKREPRYHIALRFLGYLLLSIGCVMAGYLLYTHFAFTVGDQRKAGLACLAVVGIGLALLLYKRKPSANPMSDLLKGFEHLNQTFDFKKLVNEHSGLFIVGALIVGFMLAQTSKARKSDK